ncbi:hypothetical protein HMPREF9120_00591 [Neisseria sp. oral taxon 020 str. F0370]|uniref:hypothetical protein n=1 Tax=unclassified Neisseria TaxID=2623750 RepID=UPI0002A36998|nr:MULTISPECIES: hypothetical protein [unclassified Neisseria]ASP17714.1 triose-phosphate isomerase [Neisseria sp. KEM232]EKY08829.1 hypothetical protein HMPREF9120_00591 [Neisseria sp. oral taxon 020 str. F0370]
MFIAIVSLPNPTPRAGEAFTHAWASLGAFPSRELAQAAIDVCAAKNPVQESRISQTLPRFFFQGGQLPARTHERPSETRTEAAK